MSIHRLSILGVGLLGGSIGLAARERLSDCVVVGYGHRRETLENALRLGAVHEATSDLARAVDGADLVILAIPVGLFETLLQGIRPHLSPQAVVTDVGSTKRSVVAQAARILANPERFVGSHPMAGSEQRGVTAARADLYDGALCITTPTEKTDPSAVELVESFWRALGMRLTRLDPGRHDELLADVSHLPHALATALVAMQPADALPLAGKGFADVTRIAAGDGAMWRDIFQDNAANLRGSIGRLRQELDRIESMLDGPDAGEKLKAYLDAVADRRRAFSRTRPAGGEG